MNQTDRKLSPDLCSAGSRPDIQPLHFAHALRDASYAAATQRRFTRARQQQAARRWTVHPGKIIEFGGKALKAKIDSQICRVLFEQQARERKVISIFCWQQTGSRIHPLSGIIRSAMTLAVVRRLMLFCHAMRAHRRPAVLLLAVIAPGALLASEREVLPATVTPEHYRIELTPDASSLTFHASVSIDIRVHRATHQIVLNSADIVIDSATLAGQSAAPGI